jgi:hypothetical protein
MKRSQAESAMLQRFRHLRPVPGFAARGVLLSLIALQAMPPGHASAQADSATVEAIWLPLPVEEIESPEQLDDLPDPEFGVRLQAGFRDGMLTRARMGATERQGSRRLGLTLVSGSRGEVGSAASAFDDEEVRLHVAAGRLSARGSGSLLAEQLGVARRSARVPSLRGAEPPSLTASGLTAPAFEGLGARKLGGAGSFVRSLWLFGGRRFEDRTLVTGLGCGAGMGSGSFALALGRRGRGTAVDGAVAFRTENGSAAAAEILIARGISAAILDLETRSKPVRLRGRLRYRAQDARPVASELSAEAGAHWGRARVRVSQGPSGTTGSIGRAELEGILGARERAPITFRLGRSKLEGFSTQDGLSVRRESYIVLDATIARSEGRRFSILATRRDREEPGPRRTGTSLGGRLEWVRRGRARLELGLEAVRADLAGAAWSSAYYAGGSTALRTRSKPGVESSARGSLRLGRWVLGGLVEEREDDAGTRATAGTVWITRTLPPASRHQ